MLFTRMDLLNSQFLDKMNNNVGKLYYDGSFFMFLLLIVTYHAKFPLKLTFCCVLKDQKMRLFWFVWMVTFGVSQLY